MIKAYNQNLPYDQFTIEQLAGDLLPNATLDDKIATGFNRNNMINYEGGAVPQEYHAEYIIDRASTTGTVWLGLTVGCARCHDHKFDPIRQKDFYQLVAFFNTIPERGLDGFLGNADPVLPLPTAEQQHHLDELNGQLASTLAALPEKDMVAYGTNGKSLRRRVSPSLRPRVWLPTTRWMAAWPMPLAGTTTAKRCAATSSTTKARWGRLRNSAERPR